MRLYYWLHHTAGYDGTSGVQRVVRNLAASLAPVADLVAVQWCAEREAIIHAEAATLAGFARNGGPVLPASPHAGQPLHLTEAAGLADAWLLIPEVPHVGGAGAPNLAIALDYARYYRLRAAAVFHDLIPLKDPDYAAMAPAHARYVEALRAANLLLAVSAYAAGTLRDFWRAQGIRRTPPLLAVPLPHEVVGQSRVTEPNEPAAAPMQPAPPVRFCAWGAIDPRKNQLAAANAFARLCARRPELDLRFDLVGHLHPAVAAPMRALSAAEPRIVLHGPLPDAELHALIAGADATVFLSRAEGFGLPIAESLWFGKPCLTADHGAMAELAAGGGCLTAPPDDPSAIEQALERLATDPALRRRLAAEAAARPLRSWADYAASVAAALRQTPPLDRLVLIDIDEQSAEAFTEAGVAVRRLRWHPASAALLPAEPPGPGDGQLAGQWALLKHGHASPIDIIANAQGLDLKLALEATAETPPEALAAADLTLFADDAAREAALSRALRELSKTAGLRQKLQLGQGLAALPALAAAGPRLASVPTPRRPRRIFYWVGLTVGQNFNTGVQRVVRLLAVALERLGIEVIPVKWDEGAGRMTPITAAEGAHLARWNGPPPRPLAPLPETLAGEWLLVPEIVIPLLPPDSNPGRLGHALGMRVAAIFYDMIPFKLEMFSLAALDTIRGYWELFGEVELALPISWTVAPDLARYLTQQNLRRPAIVPCVLAGEFPATPRATKLPTRPPGAPLRLFAVGTWEPRKNYPRLLRALAVAQACASRPIRLTIVGRQAEFFELNAEIETLAAATGTTLPADVGDDGLLALYEAADATVFASFEEGFGLPVLESLWHGRPCLCHYGSAMAEVAPGGGAYAIDMLDEDAIAAALLRLADEPALLARLGAEALARPIRSWDDYAEDVLAALSNATAPGWPLGAIATPALTRRQPLLSCAITTYNRAPWLAHSLDRLLAATRPWRDVVEVVVCDNASTDGTPSVVAKFNGEANFHSRRNPANVGMLGNLGVTASASRGAFVWLLGDDDLLVDGAVENILTGLASHPDVEMAYLNYAYTHFDKPEELDDPAALIRGATPIAEGGANRYVSTLRDVAALNENLFTAIYACAFRRDHALRAYQQDTSGAPFSSLATCVPSSVYALAALQDRPAWWVGEPALVVNMNVSWRRWVLLWHLERMPDLYEEAERHGIDPIALDRYRASHLRDAETLLRETYFAAEDTIRGQISMARLLERGKHLPGFRTEHLPGLRRAYTQAWHAGRVLADALPPDELFARYGFEEGSTGRTIVMPAQAGIHD